MADPSPYVVSYSFSDFQSNSPSTPLPAAALDNELANAATAVAELVASIKDMRRADGALNNGIVTFESFELGLQLTVDPTNGLLVAAAVATTQANAALTAADRSASAASATSSNNSAAAAAASAASVNLALFLPKAGNLAGIGSADTARTNINAASRDASDMTGRLAPLTGGGVSDWNNAVTSGWYAGTAAANGPDSTSTWIVQVMAYDANNVSQIAYRASAASGGSSAVEIYRRHSYGVSITWNPWESAGPVPIGSTIWVNGTVAPPGYVKENGALISRASFPALYAYAASSGNITTEAGWFAGNNGAFSNGDLATTFRLPDARGEFIRAWDDSRGVDSGRSIQAHQADSLKDHTHGYNAPALGVGTGTSPNYFSSSSAAANTSGASTGAAAETRPRNNAKLACIKF